MVENIKLLSSQRAYEFRTDELRLTMLTIPGVQSTIREAFAFQQVAIGTPMATFGAVPNTIPPGVVFNNGSIETDDDGTIPIRFLHFEAQRIAIDVAGPSSGIDLIYNRLRAVLDDVHAPDGSPVIADPINIHDRSEISSHLSFMPPAVLAPELQQMLVLTPEGDNDAPLAIPIPALRISWQLSTNQYQGINRVKAFELELRAETYPEEGRYFSSAPFPSDAHMGLLQAIEEALTPNGAEESS